MYSMSFSFMLPIEFNYSEITLTMFPAFAKVNIAWQLGSVSMCLKLVPFVF